jgi:2,4-dienoyl-CoA reductase (NADPH2)
MELKNRIVMAPLNNNYTRGGFLTDLSVDFYVSRAEGGAGLIAMEAASVDYPRSRSVLNPALDDDRYIPMFRMVADGVHRFGSKVIVQLSHVGRQTRRSTTGLAPVAPSPVASRSPAYPEVPEELSREAIAEIIRKFGKAARRAQDAGLDGVEVIMGHGYLANNFLSPVSNLRKDEYGGLQGGIRFCTDLVKEIKGACGSDFPVVCRINGDDFLMSGGNTPVEAQLLAAQLERAGADAISVSGGMRDSELSFNDHTSASPRGSWIYLAERMKKTLRIPVIAVKRLTPELAEQIGQEGKADLVAFGKPFIADPEFAGKVLEGRLDELVPCTSCCQGCYDELWMFKPITCMLNPKVGKPIATRGSGASVKKKVLVVGGGPAGCEAALAAAERGHAVILLEKRPSLGGHYRFCTYSPNKQEVTQAFSYFERSMRKYGVDVHTETEFSLDMIDVWKPDVAILSTGADFTMPPIPGTELPHVMSPIDAITGAKETGKYVVIWTCGHDCTWTCGKRSAPIPDDVVNLRTSESRACAAGHAATDTAEALAARGKIVTVVTERPALVPGMGFTNRGNLLKRFFQQNIRVSSDVRVNEIRQEGILCEKEGMEFLFYADTVVVSIAMTPRDGLEEALRGKVKEVYRTGDCGTIGNALTAIHGAYDLVQRI